MKAKYKKVIWMILGLLVIIGTFGFLNGWFAGAKDVHPPCDQLPTVDKATVELANHQKLADEVKALGEGVTVEIGKPCADDSTRGVVQITYGSKFERDAISELLTNRDGFGVPAHLVKRK